MLLEDITEAKLLERSRDEFFSIASHELRTPLTAIRGNASIINDYYLDAMDNKELRSLIGDIHESSVRLIAIVNDFLEASRLEQGKMVFQLAPFSIDDVIREVVHDMKHLLAEKQINLVFASDETTEPLTVWADAERTKQIIYNLVGNAEKFTHHGSITIHIEPTPHTVKILVSDTGSGISPENQHLLFHKFQQASNSLWTRDSSKGTGLGLYISKLLAESMDGHMQLECSELGQGSTFSFTLPLATSRQLDIKSEPANT
jgi:two-component system sensor histidine kinase EvgS